MVFLRRLPAARRLRSALDVLVMPSGIAVAELLGRQDPEAVLAGHPAVPFAEPGEPEPAGPVGGFPRPGHLSHRHQGPPPQGPQPASRRPAPEAPRAAAGTSAPGIWSSTSPVPWPHGGMRAPAGPGYRG